MSIITISVDLRSLIGPTRDQGPRPTCLAFAASDAHAILRSGLSLLSCEYVFYHAQRRAGRPPSQGALLSSMLDALRQDGQPHESSWPYLAVAPPEAKSWAPPAEVGPLFGCGGQKFSPSLDHVIQELDNGRPVIILLTLSAAFYHPTAQAVVDPAADEAPDAARRHAVVAVGHGTIDGLRALLIRNSWGLHWGDAGHGWLTEQFLVPRIFAAAILKEEVDVSRSSAPA